MSYTDLFSGKMYDFASPFEISVAPNNVISNLNLFKIEHHQLNRDLPPRLDTTLS